MASALRFKQPNLPRQADEIARLKVVSGPDFGVTFVLVGKTASIGRGDENDLILSDLKASRIHARIQETDKGFLIQDQGSVNGIVFNGHGVREVLLNNNDKVTLGETTLEFMTSQVPSKKLTATPQRFKFFQGREGTDSRGKKTQMNPLILLVAGGALFLFLFPGNRTLEVDDSPRNSGLPEPQPTGDSKGEKGGVDLSSYLPEMPIDKPAEVFYREGVREYYLGNYSRARTQFETVLQISPGFRLATIFLEKSNQAIDATVKSNLVNGKKAYSLGKLREARGYFERVMRLLYRDPTNPAFVQAREEDEKIVKELSESPEEATQ